MKKLLAPIIGLVASLFLNGCVETTVQSPHFTFKSTRFLWPGSIGEASITTNGASIKGYKSDNDPAALIKAAAQGVAEGLNPAKFP